MVVFQQYRFHQQKLVLHRASMRFYENWLHQKEYTIHYIETGARENDCRQVVAHLAEQKVTDIHVAALTDDWLHKRMQAACSKHKIVLHVFDSPNSLNTPQNVAAYFSKKKTYFQTDFYTWQRKQRNILLEKDGKPVGGKWTFDVDNRQRFPKKEKAPVIRLPKENEFVTEARQYVQLHFPKNCGSIDSPCLFVTTFAEAENWLDDFLQNRFAAFGIYEDAIVAKEAVLHHSVLSPMLNIGLLQP
jgi:deoxyribodipyrimidine photolyase-related protein